MTLLKCSQGESKTWLMFTATFVIVLRVKAVMMDGINPTSPVNMAPENFPVW